MLPLALATFAVGTDAFVMAGLLPAIAADLEVSVPAAGQLVTVFALTLAVAAPVLSWLLSPLDRRTALQLALIVFIVGNVVTALSPTYVPALLARILTAAGAATITATASSAAVAIAPAERRGRAMALVIGGLTLSTALGMPLGNLIGSVDWRLTLWAIAALGIAALIGISVALPEVVLPATSLTARLAPLRRPEVLTILVATLLVMAGHYAVYTYIGAVTAGATTGSFSQAPTVILFVWASESSAATSSQAISPTRSRRSGPRSRRSSAAPCCSRSAHSWSATWSSHASGPPCGERPMEWPRWCSNIAS
ncbi:MFS transporter [Pseudonocardia cypriaca]|uniref:MFS transporter n=1 Tax=Pseudonocardia cypriaca TaxID=882449 RepID=UPI00115011FC|nr:MFS transporter [Pseudonocardia cypriaca]